MKVHIIILALTATLVTSFCHNEKMHETGHCSYRIQCVRSIHGVNLPEECRGSSNYAGNVELIITDAMDRFDENTIDAEFLRTVTTYKATGKWTETNLSFLEYMPRLKTLKLVNKIQNIIDSPFYHLSRLETLDLSRNYLSDIVELFRFESYPNKLRKLFLAHNHIREIPAETFSELSSLEDLDLSNNHITQLDQEPFYNLTNLQLLRLNNNNIKNLNGAFNNLFNLKHLYLTQNSIESVDQDSLKIIYHLETFDVSKNQIELLNPNVFSRHWRHFGSHSVCKIILSDNQIVVLPNATKELATRFTRHLRVWNNPIDVVTELDLSKNIISEIQHNAFQSIVRLISLDLSSNRLTVFDINTKDLEHVKYLNLSTNYITTLYFKSFSSLTNLQNLDLSNNSLDDIPEQMFTDNNKLRHVNMTFNQIEALDNLRIKMFHPEGGVLDLSHNGLSRLRIPTADDLKLQMLILHSNNITDVSLIDLNYQGELKILEMNNNYIDVLDKDSLRLPMSLTSLDISKNEISYVGPSTFHRLQHLKTLRLGNNLLETLEYGTFHGLSELSNLDLSNNNIGSLDSKLMIDLKSLNVLSMRYNGLHYLDYKAWLGHAFDLRVYLEGNDISCDWLSTALNDYNNGYSKMRPAILDTTISGYSVEGIPCVGKDVGELAEAPQKVVADDRLLIITQKILEAVKDQTSYLNVLMSEMHSNSRRSSDGQVWIKSVVKG